MFLQNDFSFVYSHNLHLSTKLGAPHLFHEPVTPSHQQRQKAPPALPPGPVETTPIHPPNWTQTDSLARVWANGLDPS